ncbi:hypothetical protein FRX31_021382 [Thalictrum thalictroides]|uniref:Uncharacterized protein n=1 Tax=Thalictrum thalictroides TaxID=46969 RepID=A0A7J6VXJ2_THATH|nr:hypothetical protein FRX31_021382 [Thalictrum thalictroides]
MVVETNDHLFQSCSQTQPILHQFQSWPQQSKGIAWFKSFLRDHASMNVTSAVFLLWNIWIFRNFKIFRHQPFHTSFVYRHAIFKAHAYWAHTQHNDSRQISHQRYVTWMPPLAHWIKLNTDGSSTHVNAGIGRVLRNEIGAFIAGLHREAINEARAVVLPIFENEEDEQLDGDLPNFEHEGDDEGEDELLITMVNKKRRVNRKVTKKKKSSKKKTTKKHTVTSPGKRSRRAKEGEDKKTEYADTQADELDLNAEDTQPVAEDTQPVTKRSRKRPWKKGDTPPPVNIDELPEEELDLDKNYYDDIEDIADEINAEEGYRSLPDSDNEEPCPYDEFEENCEDVFKDNEDKEHPVHNFCHELLTVNAYKRAYENAVFPIPNDFEWDEPSYVVLPPPLHRPTGRPRGKRRRGEDEPVKSGAKVRRCK